MIVIESDPIYVRASVSGLCNLNCVYCPKKEGMENRVPNYLRGNDLSVEDYCKNLMHLARNGITGISFTGGEPTLNPNLPLIISNARKIFNRVELTTNGFRLPELLPKISSNLDLLKISLDAVDAVMVKEITKGKLNEINTAVEAIKLGYEAGLKVGVNTVVMRSNLNQIDLIINLCKSIDKNNTGKIYVSLLDFYFSMEKKDYWEREFMPLHELEDRFTKLYGKPEIQERFGCKFYWFDANGIKVRFKDSISATYRAAKCENCKLYCQEGIYGLKYSVEGWVTTCPTGDENYGVLLSPNLSNEKADSLLSQLFADIKNAKPNSNSFNELIKTHDLKPIIN